MTTIDPEEGRAYIKSKRRYYLGKRREADANGDESLRDVWAAAQAGEPGTALPSGFPATTKLAAAFYTTVEDLDGANEDELRWSGLSSREAKAVMSALAPLLT